MLDVALCEALATRAAEGDPVARQKLIEHLWPAWVASVRSSRTMGAFAQSEDAVHNVVVRLVEKLAKPEGRGIRLYVSWRQRHPEKTFADWIRIVTKNAIRDYVREQLGPPVASGEPSVKRLLNEFASSAALEELGVRPPFTLAQTARELVEFARQRLPVDQVLVLQAWLEGAEFEDIARDRGGTAEDARRSMRAAVGRLRREFGDSAAKRDDP